ncbi:MAG TPA: undecaprenyl-diphosphate phosphatase [Casimicrobiaceae bacterium]
MDHPTLLVTLILGVVEGLTEFLPVSSTGHLIVAGSLLGYTGEQAKVFEIVIQAGAILAVCWEFRARIGFALGGLLSNRDAQRFALNVAIAFIPAAVLGLLFVKAIQAHLFAPLPVAAAFIIGAFVIIWAERLQRQRPATVRIASVDAMRWTDALKVGIAQAFSLIPGTSRSGATIIGGMLFGLSRQAATEFSFFLAIPTLFAACGYEFFRNRALLSAQDLRGLGVGFAAAFVSAFLCVRWLIRYVSHHDFRPFAWYRIAFGVVILVTAWAGIVRWD